MQDGRPKPSPYGWAANRLQDYRLFKLTPNGRFAGVAELQASGDDDAIRMALKADYPYGCEVWSGPRFLGRFAGPRPNPSRPEGS